jgi:hypothetical protein
MIGFMHFTKIILLLATYEEKNAIKLEKEGKAATNPIYDNIQHTKM